MVGGGKEVTFGFRRQKVKAISSDSSNFVTHEKLSPYREMFEFPTILTVLLSVHVWC